jgi:hypothetical protein
LFGLVTVLARVLKGGTCNLPNAVECRDAYN